TKYVSKSKNKQTGTSYPVLNKCREPFHDLDTKHWRNYYFRKLEEDCGKFSIGKHWEIKIPTKNERDHFVNLLISNTKIELENKRNVLQERFSNETINKLIEKIKPIVIDFIRYWTSNNLRNIQNDPIEHRLIIKNLLLIPDKLKKELKVTEDFLMELNESFFRQVIQDHNSMRHTHRRIKLIRKRDIEKIIRYYFTRFPYYYYDMPNWDRETDIVTIYNRINRRTEVISLDEWYEFMFANIRLKGKSIREKLAGARNLRGKEVRMKEDRGNFKK
ncbi:unnamed protein product, partial [marine sediment metagenome]